MLRGSSLVRLEPLVTAAVPEVEAVLEMPPSTIDQEWWEDVGAFALWPPQLGLAEEKPLSGVEPTFAICARGALQCGVACLLFPVAGLTTRPRSLSFASFKKEL